MSQIQFTGLRGALTVIWMFAAASSLCADEPLPIPEAVKADQATDWYDFSPQNDIGPSTIGMEDWIEAPAGNHGGVRMVDDHFEFEDGTRIKFWGVNNCHNDVCPSKEDADQNVAHYRKYGVNGVRFHKFTNADWEGLGSLESSIDCDPEKLKLFDYYTAKLKEAGIYHGWSTVFGLRLRPDARDRLIAYDELFYDEVDGKGRRKPAYLTGVIFVSEDIQDVLIERVVKLLDHTNENTGLRYADDPALSYLEFHNEDSLFWFGKSNSIRQFPTYDKIFRQKFSAWLRKKYGSHEALVQAWGADALNLHWIKDEHLDKDNIQPLANAGFMMYLGDAKRRRLDNARFLYDLQNEFYGRFEQAIRKTGYKGPLVGSCWMGGAGVPHYYNLHSDYKAGVIDRHGYWGTTGRLGTNKSMLALPGTGFMSRALWQVADRPFQLTEWITLSPCEWAPEACPLVSVYGMGLQGWDASYEFNSHGGHFAESLGSLWELDQPTELGVYPALARMIYRGDVKEAPVVTTRYVSLAELDDGEIGFEEEFMFRGSIGDTAGFGGTYSAALPVGRAVVEFTDKPTPTKPFDVAPYKEGDTIKSVTGQLEWTHRENKGYFTVNTDGTKAVVGFLPQGRPFELGDVTITSNNLFASIFLTSLEKDRTIAEANRLLVTAVARTRNTGMRYSADRKEWLMDRSRPRGQRKIGLGTGPIQLEPVHAQVSVRGKGTPTVYLLDHDGRRTERTVPVEDGVFTIDGTRDKTLYYEIVY